MFFYLSFKKIFHQFHSKASKELTRPNSEELGKAGGRTKRRGGSWIEAWEHLFVLNFSFFLFKQKGKVETKKSRHRAVKIQKNPKVTQ